MMWERIIDRFAGDRSPSIERIKRKYYYLFNIREKYIYNFPEKFKYNNLQNQFNEVIKKLKADKIL